MLMVHEFGQRMVVRGRGAIVNAGSTVIVRGSPRAPQYAAGKYGLLGITGSYAKALGPGVRVNTFATGFMETEALLARPPSGRPGAASWCARRPPPAGSRRRRR
jgi:3-oxoacyl-[acyl-carrier protein] reductase